MQFLHVAPSVAQLSSEGTDYRNLGLLCCRQHGERERIPKQHELEL